MASLPQLELGAVAAGAIVLGRKCQRGLVFGVTAFTPAAIRTSFAGMREVLRAAADELPPP